MEQISPNGRKGYFPPHAPLTTTSARSCHVLERQDKAKTAASRKTTSHSCPAFESQMLNQSPVVLVGCGQAPTPAMIPGQSWFGFRTHGYKAAHRRQQWCLSGMISLPILEALFLQTIKETIQLQLSLQSIRSSLSEHLN